MIRARPAACGALSAPALPRGQLARLGLALGLVLGLGLFPGFARPALAASDFRDVALISAAVNLVLENERSGVKVPWSNPETGHQGYVIAERTFFLDPRTPCRDYRRSMHDSSGRTLEVSGTGCRKPDGRWELDEQAAALPVAPEAGPVAAESEPGIAGAPATDPKPEPPTPLLRGAGKPTRAPNTAEAPADLPEPAAGPRSAPVPVALPAPKTATAPEAPPILTQSGEARAAAQTHASKPPPPVRRPEIPRLSVSLPSKSEG